MKKIFGKSENRKMNKGKRNTTTEEKGITLIALIIIIIILIILAAILIATVNGNGGLFGRAKDSTSKYKNSQNEENDILSDYEKMIDDASKDLEYMMPIEEKDKPYVRDPEYDMPTEDKDNSDESKDPIIGSSSDWEVEASTNTVVKYKHDWSGYPDIKIPSIVKDDTTGEEVVIKNIGSGIFAGDSYAKSLTIPYGIENIKSWAFAACNNLKENILIPSTVKNIESNAFVSSGIEGIKLRYGLETIGDYAFANCTNLNEDLVIPSSVTNIANSAFSSSYRTGEADLIIYNNDAVQDNSYPFSSNTFKDVKVNGKKINDGEFNTNLTIKGHLILGEDIKSIGNSSFANQSSMNGKLVLPSKIESIGNQAFYRCSNLNGILSTPGTLKKIDSSAFQNCSKFEQLDLRYGLEEIGSATFLSCTGLKSDLVLPSSLKSIGGGAFNSDYTVGDGDLIIYNNCFQDQQPFVGAKFKNVKVDGEKITESEFSYYKVNDKNNNKNIEINGHVVFGDNIKEIGSAAFYAQKNANGNLVLSDNLETIGNAVFYDCNFTGSLVMPASLKSVGGNVFNGCFKTGEGNLIIYNNNFAESNNSIFYGTKFKNLSVNGSKIYDYEFNSNMEIDEKLVLGENIKEIGSGAFNSQNKLKGKLVLPNNLESIGVSAFQDCNFTGSLVIPSSVKTIGDFAFYNSFKTGDGDLIIYNNSFDSSSGNRFGNCTFKNLKVNGEKIYDYEFSYPKFTDYLILGENIKEIGSFAFQRQESLKGKLIIPSSVKTIKDSAFMECTGFDELVLNEGIEELDYDAFYQCDFKNDLIIPESLKKSEDCVFYGAFKSGTSNLIIRNNDSFSSLFENNQYADPFNTCKFKDLDVQHGKKIYYGQFDNASFQLFGHVTLSDEIEEIDDEAFCNENEISGELKLPSNLKKLGKQAFQSCKKLTGKLEIPGSVEQIGDNAFLFCSGFSDITIKDGAKNIGKAEFVGANVSTFTIENFESITNPESLYGSSDVLTIKKGNVNVDATFFQCSRFKKIVFEDGVTSINSLIGSVSTEEIVLPSNLTKINDSMFESCISLTKIDIPSTVTSIGKSAFKDCKSLDLTVPSSVTTIGEDAFKEIKHVTYNGSASGSPWGATSIS